VGLKVNEDKTKVLIQTRSNRRRGQNMTTGDQNFEVVNDFTYLDCNISSKRDEMKEIQRRISKTNVYYHISTIIRSGNVRRKTKLKLYKTIIRPVLCYGSETWTTSQRAELMVNAFERKILRRIYGPVQENGQWRIRYTHEIYQLFAGADLATTIRLQRVKWAKHLQRMEESRVVKRIFNQKLEVKRPVGQGWLGEENRGGQDPIWAVAPLDGLLILHCTVQK